MTRYARFPLFALVMVLLCCVASVVLADEQVTDKALLAKAKQAATAGRWDDVVTTMEELRRQYPESALIPDSTVLLYQSYLVKPVPEKAEALWKEVQARWPKSNTLWLVIEAKCWVEGKNAPAKALALLEQILQQDMLDTRGRSKAQLLRYEYLAIAIPEQFVKETVELVKKSRAPLTLEDLNLVRLQVQQAYPLLMKSGQYEVAKAMSVQVQELIATSGNPKQALLADSRAYYTALRTADAKRHLAEALTVIKMAQWADTVDEITLAAELAGPLYLELVRTKPFAEVKALHDVLHASLQRLDCAETHKYEWNAWLGALMNGNKEQLAIEMTALIGKMKTAKAADEISFRIEFTESVYMACYKAKLPEQAQALHAQIQDFLTRFKLTNDAVTDRAQYARERLLFLRITAKDKYLTEASPMLVEVADASRTKVQLDPALNVACAYSLYTDLCRAGRTADASKLYERIAVALTRVDPKDIANVYRNCGAYFVGFATQDPEGFYPVFQPFVAKATKGCTLEEIKLLVSVAKPVYLALASTGRVSEAKELHLQLQAATKQAPNAEKLAVTEYQEYLSALSEAFPAAFLDELQPTIAGLTKIQTVDEALKNAPYVQMAYVPLNQIGRFLDAKTAHEQLQSLLIKFNRTAEAESDRKKFKESLSTQSLDAMLQLFKKALTTGDREIAQKWMRALDDAAMESPQAIRAHTIWKESTK